MRFFEKNGPSFPEIISHRLRKRLRDFLEMVMTGGRGLSHLRTHNSMSLIVILPHHYISALWGVSLPCTGRDAQKKSRSCHRMISSTEVFTSSVTMTDSVLQTCNDA